MIRVGDRVRLEPRRVKALHDQPEWWWTVTGFSDAYGIDACYAREGGIVRRFDVPVSKILEDRR